MGYSGIVGPNLRINNGISRDMAYGFIDRVQPAWALIQNDPECAINTAARGVNIIYRQSGDGTIPNQSADQFMRDRIHDGFEQFKKRIYIHATNEVDPSPTVDAFNKECSNYCHSRGFNAALFNHSTNKKRDGWEIHRATIKTCVARGDLIGFHFYDDTRFDDDGFPIKGTGHLDSAYHWLPLRKEFGGLWGCTEFSHIRSIFDADHGPKNFLGEKEHRDFWSYHAPFFQAYGIPMLGYSLDDWPANEDGKKNGFGYYGNEDLTKHFVFLDSIYSVKDIPVVTQIIHVNPPTTGGVKAAVSKMPSAFVNFREEPDSRSADQGDLHKNEPVTYFPNDTSDGWVYVIRESDGAKGWVSKQAGAVEFVPALLPDVAPSVSIRLYGATEAQRDQFAENLRIILDAITSVSIPSGVSIEVE